MGRYDDWAQRKAMQRCNLDELPDPSDREWYRASHLCECETCGQLYVHHPSWPEEPSLVILCNGDRVKL